MCCVMGRTTGVNRMNTVCKLPQLFRLWSHSRCQRIASRQLPGTSPFLAAATGVPFVLDVAQPVSVSKASERRFLSWGGAWWTSKRQSGLVGRRLCLQAIKKQSEMFFSLPNTEHKS